MRIALSPLYCSIWCDSNKQRLIPERRLTCNQRIVTCGLHYTWFQVGDEAEFNVSIAGIPQFQMGNVINHDLWMDDQLIIGICHCHGSMACTVISDIFHYSCSSWRSCSPVLLLESWFSFPLFNPHSQHGTGIHNLWMEATGIIRSSESQKGFNCS